MFKLHVDMFKGRQKNTKKNSQQHNKKYKKYSNSTYRLLKYENIAKKEVNSQEMKNWNYIRSI